MEHLDIAPKLLFIRFEKSTGAVFHKNALLSGLEVLQFANVQRWHKRIVLLICVIQIVVNLLRRWTRANSLKAYWRQKLCLVIRFFTSHQVSCF